jgi:DNA-binding NtrC family response regulator
MITYSVYVVDDEELIREASQLTLGKTYRVKVFADGESCLAAMQSEPADLVLLDIGLPGMSGIDTLKAIKDACPDVLVIMITADDEIDTVITAMKLGAHDYVVKPINMDALKVNIRNALQSIKLRKEVQLLQEQYLRENMPYFIGASDTIQEVMHLVRMVARSPDATVLILGETGTGKELIASALHYYSPHFKGPFVPVNCSAIPDNLVESELFGYEKGAFSGADPGGKKGLIEAAAAGTLFLDEAGDLSLQAQAKLLRFLENGEYYKVGGTRRYRTQTRIVAATNHDLESLMEEGRFRRDLFFRLAAIKVEVPSLNRRPQDILPMAQHFLTEFGRKYDKTFTGLGREAEQALHAHQWKGNIRELRNLIERAVLLGRGPELTAPDLGLDPDPDPDDRGTADVGHRFPAVGPQGLDLPALHAALDRHYFRTALELNDGNATQAANHLGLSYYAFRRRREKLKI